jgi:hypothetical protein
MLKISRLRVVYSPSAGLFVLRNAPPRSYAFLASLRTARSRQQSLTLSGRSPACGSPCGKEVRHFYWVDEILYGRME